MNAIRSLRRAASRSLPVLFCLLATVGLYASPGTQDEYRFGMPVNVDLAALLDKPDVTDMGAETWEDPENGEKRIAGWSEIQGVFDVPFEDFVAVLTDYVGQPRYSPRLFSASVESREGPYTRVFQEVGISVLGIKSKYRVVVDFEEQRFPDGGFGQRSRLVESPDGNLYESFSSWYVLPVQVGGKSCVYVRGFSRPGIRKTFPGMAGALRTFTPGEVKRLLGLYVKECRKLAGRSPS